MKAFQRPTRSNSTSNTDVSSDNGTSSGKDVGFGKASESRTSSNPFSLFRRRSTFKGVAQGISGMLKLRRLTKPVVKPKIRMENTYKMAPDSGEHIATSKVERIAQQVLEKEIGNQTYDSYKVGDMACTLSAKIKEKVKELNFPRYRIICQVVITQVTDQGLEATSRCLWDTSCDNFAAVSYKNESIAAIAMIYGVYLE